LSTVEKLFAVNEEAGTEQRELSAGGCLDELLEFVGLRGDQLVATRPGVVGPLQ
jgi:hypothetical protein